MTALKEMIRDLGGEEGIRQRSEEFRQALDFFFSQKDALVAAHPQKWVAVAKDGIVAVGDSLEAVLAEAKRKGLRNTDILVRHLDPNPPGWFL